VRYKGQLYFTEDEEPVEPAPLAGSFVQFFINGKSHGPAFLDIREGTYYPAVSLYTHTHQEIPASVSVEFATDGFKHSLPAAELAGGNMVLPVARLAELKPTQH